jgi:hypothetical protein
MTIHTGAMTAAAPVMFPIVQPSLGPASTAATPVWLLPAYGRLRQLEQLKSNWDGRHSAAVSIDAILFSREVLSRIMPPTMRPPSIVPLGHGGLLLSWEFEGAELDIEVIAPNKLIATYKDKATDIEEEWLASNELSRLVTLLWSNLTV